MGHQELGRRIRTLRPQLVLRLFSANGIYDLATPFTSTEWELAHRAPTRISYLNVDALKQFRQDLTKFCDTAK